jgi:hypothetical protein
MQPSVFVLDVVFVAPKLVTKGIKKKLKQFLFRTFTILFLMTNIVAGGYRYWYLVG